MLEKVWDAHIKVFFPILLDSCLLDSKSVFIVCISKLIQYREVATLKATNYTQFRTCGVETL